MCFEIPGPGARPARSWVVKSFKTLRPEPSITPKLWRGKYTEITNSWSLLYLLPDWNILWDHKLGFFVYTQSLKVLTCTNSPGILSIYTFCSSVIMITPFLSDLDDKLYSHRTDQQSILQSQAQDPNYPQFIFFFYSTHIYLFIF